MKKLLVYFIMCVLFCGCVTPSGIVIEEYMLEDFDITTGVVTLTKIRGESIQVLFSYRLFTMTPEELKKLVHRHPTFVFYNLDGYLYK